VRRLLDVHVLEVVGDEQGEGPVELLGGGCAPLGSDAAQHGHHLGQLGDVLHVFLVLVADALAGPGRPRLDGRVHEGVLVRKVGAAHAQQLQHALARLRQVLLVRGVHAADGQQGVGHEGAQRLVDAAIHVEARRLGGRDLFELLGGDLHVLLSCG
jgi:hypothetical protein